MQVMDIIRRAAFNCGVVASFNPEEMPGDVEAAGYKLLVDEVLPTLNCDRTLDVTVTARVFKPINNQLVLSPIPVDSKLIVLGRSSLSHLDLQIQFSTEAVPLNQSLSLEWPQDDSGQPLQLAIWSVDNRLVYSTSLTTPATLDPNINIEFHPMRVDAVFDDDTRAEYTCMYRHEFESATGISTANTYAIEMHEDNLIIMWHKTASSKCIVLPVPLSIEQSSFGNNPYAGKLRCPAKFRQYLVDALAVRLAIVYDLSTAPAMHAAAMISYNLLKKNIPVRVHAPNTNTQIGNILRRARGR